MFVPLAALSKWWHYHCFCFVGVNILDSSSIAINAHTRVINIENQPKFSDSTASHRSGISKTNVKCQQREMSSGVTRMQKLSAGRGPILHRSPDPLAAKEGAGCPSHQEHHPSLGLSDLILDPLIILDPPLDRFYRIIFFHFSNMERQGIFRH